ncbi:uncharacterized protein FSUBG_4964 [Fusarium subglutinans]|uniref:Uncharacterized protein n=1 Tax=Gibberella subglutinans TaxID=42677 RepID=A0A8H5V1X3_GIBSU|nr:uncharacterized protein FSUBG_4964 [Fusarium subglutinans]KAF5607862.1 hypothetical protein FSUBG_4964 [Fusarium subglutinans]
MLHALIAAQEDDVRRWSSCPSFGPFIHKLFVQSPNVSHVGPRHPTGRIGFSILQRFSSFLAYAAKTPVDSAASLTLRGPSNGEPFPFPIRGVLARLMEYGQYELHKVRMANRFDNKTIKYVDAQAFPSENFSEARNKDQLKEVNVAGSLYFRYNEMFDGRDVLELNTRTAFEEHLEVVGNRMRDNGHNIKIHVPDEVIETEVKNWRNLPEDLNLVLSTWVLIWT